MTSEVAVMNKRGNGVMRRLRRRCRVCAEQLSGEAVSLVVKERVAAARLDPSGFSGHSLRAGFATSAVQARGAADDARRGPGEGPSGKP